MSNAEKFHEYYWTVRAAVVLRGYRRPSRTVVFTLWLDGVDVSAAAKLIEAGQR